MVFKQMRSQMKGVLIVVIAAFALSLLYAGGTSLFGGGSGRDVNVAKVNGQAITYAEFEDAYRNNLMFYEQYQGRLSRSDADQVRFQTMQQMVNQKLMLQEVRKNRVKVDPKDIDAELKSIKDSFPSEEEYKARLKESKLTEKQLRNLIRDNLAIEALQKMKSQVEITDEDVKRAYEQVRASHILIEPVGEDRNFDLAKVQAEKVLAEIKSGKISFADAAKKYSADSGSKANGGDLDFFTRDSGFVQEFVDAAFALKPGEISEPVRTQFGYHLIKVTGFKAAEGEEFEKQKEELRQKLTEEAGAQQFSNWFNEVRASARVELKDHALQAQQFIVNGQLPQAVAQYQEAIKENPSDPHLHLALGNVYQQLNDPDRALEEYKTAADMGSNDPEIYLTLGVAYYRKGMKDEAAAELRKASDLDPMDFQLHLTLLQLYTQMQLEQDAKNEEAKLTAIQKQIEAQQKAYEELQKSQAEANKQ